MPYQKAFNDFVDSPETQNRDLIATILLDAVEQSFIGDMEARKWLRGVYAQSLLLLLDINPEAALEHLAHKWTRIDGRLH
ncbi:hypothetical protein HF289_08655 [Acidithiobacillus ferrooxidans]|nr:hypothetical protein [Acidithiobacillus ferrooxidans]